MKKFTTAFILLVASGCWLNSIAAAENLSGNTLFETMHIKQMAKQKFTNNGRTKYVYVEHKHGIVSPVSSISKKCYKSSGTGNTAWDTMQRKHNKNLPPCNTNEIGAVHLGKDSKVRELNIAVDYKTTGLKPVSGSREKVSIAPVYVEGRAKRQLKKVNTVVHNNGKLHN